MSRYTQKEKDLDFIRWVQNIFISENGYIVDTGNYQTVNDELMRRVDRKIKKHPLIWKLFFMVG